MITRARPALEEPHPRMGALISSYQDGLASAAEADQVQRHLLTCDRCRAFYGGLQDARERVAGLPPAANPAAVDAGWRDVLARIAPGHR